LRGAQLWLKRPSASLHLRQITPILVMLLLTLLQKIIKTQLPPDMDQATRRRRRAY
jgi:hypothetical protein